MVVGIGLAKAGISHTFSYLGMAAKQVRELTISISIFDRYDPLL